jgi:hypothetical protein
MAVSQKKTISRLLADIRDIHRENLLLRLSFCAVNLGNLKQWNGGAIAQKSVDNGKYGSERSFKQDLERSWKKTQTNFWEGKLQKATRLGILWPKFRLSGLQ